MKMIILRRITIIVFLVCTCISLYAKNDVEYLPGMTRHGYYNYSGLFYENGTVTGVVEKKDVVSSYYDKTYYDTENLFTLNVPSVALDYCIGYNGWEPLWNGEAVKHEVTEIKDLGIGGAAMDNLIGLTGCELINRIGPWAFQSSNLVSMPIMNYLVLIEREAFAKTALINLPLHPLLQYIDDFAFSDCPFLTTVFLGPALYYLGLGVFENCSQLEIVNMDQCNLLKEIPNMTFYGCRDLDHIALPSGIRKIGDNAFYGCHELEEFIAPEDLDSLGYSVFEDCSSMGLLDLSKCKGLKSISEKAFKNCVSLKEIRFGEGLERIEKSAFENCAIEKLVLPASVKYVEKNAFRNCKNLKHIVFEGSMSCITSDAIAGCDSLNEFSYVSNEEINTTYNSKINVPRINLLPGTTVLTNKTLPATHSSIEYVSLPDGLKEIGYEAFAGCRKISEISIPNTVVTIGNYAFSNCISLKEITIPKSIKSLGKELMYECTSLKKVNIPSTVEEIPEGMLSGCSSLESIKLPSSVKSIGDGAFCYCSKLSTIVIPNACESIGGYSFYECSNLSSVIIGSGVNEIGYDAFSRCYSLQKIVSLAITPPVTMISFYGLECSEIKLYVPDSSVEAYKAADEWKEFFIDKNSNGITSISSNSTVGKVYNLHGVQIKTTTPDKHGVYILNGKKIIGNR